MAPARGQLGPSFIGCHGGIRIRSCKANPIQGHWFLKLERKAKAKRLLFPTITLSSFRDDAEGV